MADLSERRSASFFVIIFWLISSEVFAQNRSQLFQLNNQNIYANGQGAITGPILNGVLSQIISGTGNQDDSNNWTGANTFQINPTLSSCLGIPTSTEIAPVSCLAALGPSYLAPGAAAGNGALPHVANTLALQSYSYTFSATVVRDGYYTPGDGGGATYVDFAGACPLNSGAGDGGSEIPATSGHCWELSDTRSPQNVRVYGAEGNGTHDDYSELAAATAVASTSGGEVFFPQGYFCDKTGPLATSQQGVVFQGIDRQGTSVLSACGADVSLISVNGEHDVIRRLEISGSQVLTTTHALINLGTGCVECTVEEVYGEYGSQAVNASSGTYGSEVYVRWSKFQYQYGTAALYFENTGGNVFRTKLDQPWPAGTPAAKSQTMANWAATTSYSTGTVVVNGAFILQATVGGTSGSSAPTNTTYGTNISDGGVTWQIASPTGQYAIQCDTGCGAVLDISLNDISSTYSYGFGMTNGFAGAAPSLVQISGNTFGSLIYNAMSMGAGVSVVSSGNFISGLIAAASTAISLFGNFSGDATFVGDQVCYAQTGYYIGAGTNVTIENAVIGATTTAVSVAAGVSHWSASNSKLGTSARCGSGGGGGGSPNTNGVVVAPGSSDYYTIVNNDFYGTTTAISDGGSGVHKTVSPNP